MPTQRPPVRILLVDDDPDQCAYLSFVLSSYPGHRYQIAGVISSGEVAIAEGPALMPDLLLIDIHLAGEINGIEVGAHFRTKLNLPIVFLSADTSFETLELVKNVHPEGFIVKPCDGAHLLTVIRRLTGKG